MRFEQLEYLIEIAKQNSMSTASEQLHLAPQTLSISMKNLEKELGFAILNRTAKGATLTAEGEVVLKFALKTITGYYDMLARCRPSSQAHPAASSLQGELTIYANPVFTSTMLPYYTRMFLNQYADVKLTVLSGYTQQICDRVHQQLQASNTNHVLGITVLPYVNDSLISDYIPRNNCLSFKVFGTSQYYCCVSKNSPLAKHQTLSIRKLLEYPLILYSSAESAVTPLMYLLQQYCENPNIVLSVSEIPFWAQAVNDNLGIGFINNMYLTENSFVKRHLDMLTFIKIKESLLSINGFLYASVPDPIMTAFMEQWPTYHPFKSDPQFESDYIPLYR